MVRVRGYSAEPSFHRWVGDDLELRIHAQPGAKRSEVQGVLGTSLKVRVRARAIEGAANEALLEFLADELQVPRGRCELVSGEKHREKRILVREAPRAHCESVLARWAAQGRTSS